MPKHIAYKPYTATDGLLTWTVHSFDNRGDWTDDDIELHMKMINECAPNARITAMQLKLNGLKNNTPAIQAHVDAIRAMYAGLDNHHSVDPNGLQALASAEELWRKIILLRDMLPKANIGIKSSNAQSERAKSYRKLSEQQSKFIVSEYQRKKQEGSVYGEVKALAGRYDVTEKTINNIIKKSGL